MPEIEPFEQSLILLREAKRGDTDALGRVLERYRPRLLARIRLMMGPRARQQAEGQDFLQSVFGEVVRKFGDFELRDEVRFMRWMTTIARNKIHDSHRRHRERALESLSISVTSAVGCDDEALPPQVAEVAEEVERLVDLLEQLSEDHRHVIELRDLDGLRFRELGERLGKSEDAVRMLHARAMVRLGQLMGRDRAG